MIVNGIWVGWGLGDHSSKDFTVQHAKAYMRADFSSYAGTLEDTNIFDQHMHDVVVEMQQRLAKDGKLVWDQFILGVLDLPTEYAMGFKKKGLPVYISIEGHSSNMDFGPVADTGEVLQGEGRWRHQKTGYNNGSLPFNNQDGVDAIDENVRLRGGNGDKYFGAFSQGAICLFDYFQQHGIPPRTKGVLLYGNPCRGQGSVAEWCDLATIAACSNTHGLDPLQRFDLPGCVALGSVPHKDVLRKGDIFSDEDDSLKAKIAMAVYQAVARGDIMSNPYSITANIVVLFTDLLINQANAFQYVFAIVMEIIGAIGFLASGTNPHYAPFDITGGINWMRGLLIANG